MVVDVDVDVEFVVDEVSVVVMSASPTLASVAAIAKPHTASTGGPRASRVAYYGGSSYFPSQAVRGLFPLQVWV